MTQNKTTLRTEAWHLEVPEEIDSQSPLLVIPTVHPRGDRRIVRCAQVALDSGFRVLFIWLGTGEAVSGHEAVQEVLLRPACSRRERIGMVRRTAAIAREADGDAWHIHDFYFLPFARAWNKRSKRPILYDVHEYYADYYSEMLPLPKVLRAGVGRLLEAYQVKTTRAIGAANVVAEQMAVPYRDAAVPVVVSPNYPLLQQFRKAPVVPFVQRRYRVLHIGTLTPSYGSLLLVQMARRAHERSLPFSFDVIERYPSQQSKDAFSGLVAQAGNPPNLNLIPPRPSHEMAGTIAQAGFGLSLLAPDGQNDEAIPSKNYEHVISGVVGVVTPRPAQLGFMREFGVCITGEENNPDSFLDSMLALTQKADATHAQLTRYAEQAECLFTWEGGSAPGLEEVFGRLQGGKVRST